MFKNLTQRFSRDIGIDLGTANTLVFIPEKGIVIDEPSVVAIHNKTGQILAVGNEAKYMLGKTPPHITVTRPLSHGIISDYEVTEKMLKYFIDKVHEDSRSFMTRPRIVVCVPLEVTEVEVKAVEDAAVAAGAKEVHVVQEPMAAAIGVRMPIQDPIGNMIIDIGGGNTDVAVISLSGIVTWKSTETAGDEMNKNIVQYAREVFNLLIGETYAEQMKIKIGSAILSPERMEFPMRGRDVVSGLPREIMVTNEHIHEALERSVNTIITLVKATLEQTPPELTADIHERGVLLTGGGAMLRGFDTIIARAIEIPVRVSSDPLTDVVRGTGILLEDRELLKEIELPSARAV
ncbi:MAG: rod shape-determining protein [Candidatus Magasanikbacteria bacterium CG_4_9_14_0_2_um_filter_42_11]|uniref:Cell shape-determining protein MreB n=1 Tax=Candidatus Magasanikbacteria bacterium CG_4_9_14_0_2_um_filter_42_11 TaxID=1974643 RepID=A0A2M8F913_9BACT|nr:MAG: rod shape-determining protein [Candidatus Magasanikbacteria bacterium CG10_big_fil_rev_8_21_14_0_10_43_9]PIY92663.1 MAG: rod shape-determining protein [Candidatus Magasanikbacteria bacterium CG_4_10_14_0_8_um_filter_42_12]PJC52223.1 MAG: rod shape-determining protein [Candidatus Magasanikbacteria bacterium CG_4_9_14_0_2_um_filter_42_11]